MTSKEELLIILSSLEDNIKELSMWSVEHDDFSIEEIIMLKEAMASLKDNLWRLEN